MPGFLATGWDRLPLLGRLLVTASTALVIAGTAMLLAAVRIEAGEARESLRLQLAAETDTLPLALAEILVIGDFSALQQTLDRYVTRPQIARLVYRDASGATVSSVSPPPATGAPAWFVRHSGLVDLNATVPAEVGGRVYGSLDITLTAGNEVAKAWKNLRQHLVILALAIALDFLGILLVLRGGLRPLRVLDEGARALGLGKLDTRIAARGSPELMHSIQAFNRMAEALQATQTALLREKERLQVTLSSIGDGVIATDADGRVAFMNPVAEQLTGWAQSEARGERLDRVLRIVDEITRLGMENPVDRVLRDGQLVEPGEHTLLISRDGTEWPIADSAAPIRVTGDGAILGAVLVLRDQSRERVHLESLRQGEQLASVQRDLLHTLGLATDETTAMRAMLEAARRLPGIDGGAVYRPAAGGGNALCHAEGLGGEYLEAIRAGPPGHPAVGPSPDGEARYGDAPPADRASLPGGAGQGVRTYAMIPVRHEQREIATLFLVSHMLETLPDFTRWGLETLSGYLGEALVRLDLQARMAAIEAERSRLAMAVAQSPTTIVITDTEGTLIYVNPAFCAATGYSAEEALGSNPRILKSGHTSAAEYRAMWDALTRGQSWHGIFRNRRKDGVLFWESAHISPIFDDRGRITHYVGIKENITERVQSEEKLRLAASVFSEAGEGILITDAESRIIEVNKAFTRLTGYQREEVLGRSPDILKSGLHDPEFYAGMWKTLAEQGSWRGEVWNRRKDGELYAEQLTITTVRDSKGRVSNYVSLSSDITEMKRYREQIEHLAYYDVLTQLPNRILLGDRMKQNLARAQRQGNQMAVCYLDLDGFKAVNDSHGHKAGDHLLIEVARRLRELVREEDTVARLGGDEFVLLLTDIGSVDDTEVILARALHALCQPYALDSGVVVSISASIGVTLFPGDGGDPDTLLRHADHSMYLAKQEGRNRIHFFDANQDRLIRKHRDAKADIQRALRGEEFTLYWQPKVDLRLGRVVGAEALIRWQRPDGALIYPGDFLHQIEDDDLIVELGDWVLRTAVRQLSAWRAAGLSLSISVNVAARQIHDPGFIAKLDALLEAYPGIAPRRLELEILETAALEDLALVNRVIRECRERGIGFALDDFGTGYSSMTYFRRLPVDTVKIDQSFVRDMLDDKEDLAIVEGILGMTQAFGKQAVAEGVENVEHGVLLLRLGCRYAQGYAIGRPMPGAEVPAWVAAYVPHPVWANSLSMEWGIEDFPLLVAGLEHARWLEELRAYATGEAGLFPHVAHGHPAECRLGTWLREHGEGLAGMASYAELRDWHALIRDDLVAAYDSVEAGDRERATRLAEHAVTLLPRFEEIIGQLRLDMAMNRAGML